MLSSTIFSKPKQITIKIVFKAENVNQIQKFCYRTFTYENMLKFIEQKRQQLNFDKQKKISQFVRDGQKFIKFQKGKCQQILQRDEITVQFLYTKKRDELQKKINRFSQIVQHKLNQIKQINDEYKEGSSKVTILRKLVSSQSSSISQNIQSKNQIHVTLLISDPLVKQCKGDTSQREGANFQGFDLQEHAQKLQQESVSSKSLKIQVNKKIAFYDRMNSYFPKLIAYTSTKIVRIVTFLTKVTKQQDNELYISFQNESTMGQQKLIKADTFFQQTVFQLNIEALLIVGINTNLLSKYKAPFPIILVSTYSFNIDKGMRCFVQNFYMHIFQKKQIEESYNLALLNFKKLFYQTNYQNQFLCCCLHQHKLNCSWNKIIGKIGISLAHKIFNHQSIRSTQNFNILQPLQQLILDNTQQKCCSSLSERCCSLDHFGKALILKKISFVQPISKKILWSQQDSDFTQQKNKYQKKDNFQKMSMVRRCPIITFQIIQKIINEKQVVTFIGNKKVGKGYLIQASRVYIQERKTNFYFQHVEFTESALQKQITNMFKISKQKRSQFKNVVFIHNNYSINFQTEFFKKIKQKKKGKNLPFTILIKIIKQQIDYNNQDCGSSIIIGKLTKIQLLAEVLYELAFKQFKSREQIKEIQRFCEQNKEKLTYKTIRNFLKYYKQKQTPSLSQTKSIINQYNLINMEFKQRMEEIYKKSNVFYQFIGFLAQFQQGIYLIKLNSLILSQFFQINEIKKHLNNRQNTFNILDISTTLVRSKDGAKSQEILFILPEQAVVNYFNNKEEQKVKYAVFKYKYFYCLFQVLWRVLKQNRKLLLQKMKITSDIFFDGIFMLEVQAKNMIKNQAEMIEKTSKSIIHFYSQKYEIIQQNQSKKRRKNSLQNKIKLNKQVVGQKMLRLLFGQIEKYILHHHSTNFSKMIQNYGKLVDESESKKSIQMLKNQKNQKTMFDKQLLCRLSLIIICKKVLIIYDIVLKQSFDHQNLKGNIKNCVKHLQEELSHKKIVNTQMQYKNKGEQLKKSFSNFQQNKKNQYKNMYFSKEEYFSELICLIQLQILLKMKIISLPKVQIHSKSQQYLPSLRKLEEQGLQQIRIQITHESFVPDQQFQIMQVLNKLVNYQKNKQQIQKMKKNYQSLSAQQIQQIVVKIDQSISVITDLLDLSKIFSFKNYVYLSSLTQDKLIMQMLRLLMDKIKIHYEIYQQNKANYKKLLPRNNYKLRQLNYLLNQYYRHLKGINQCFNSEQVNIFLKNVELCKKYMNFVLENDKSDIDLQYLGDCVYQQYQKLFYFMKEKTCKKVIFNSQNLIVFMKSRVMMFRNAPYVFIRKRNVTMKYIKKILHKRDVKISFFALNRGNFSLLEVDSNNEKCQIYYLVLTVDTIIQKGQIKLLFQHAQSIHEDIVQLNQFVSKVNKMKIVFLLITGQNSQILCEQLNKKLENPPIIISLQNKQYSFRNYLPFINQNIIEEEDQFVTQNKQNKLSTQEMHTNQISKYMDIQIYHSMLDLVICSIISLITEMTDQNSVQLQNSLENTNQQRFNSFNIYKQINNVIYKSIRRAKDILWPIWYAVQEIQMEIQYKIYIKNEQQSQHSNNLPHLDRFMTFPAQRGYSIQKQQQLKNKFSLSQQQQVCNEPHLLRYLPKIKKGQLTDLNSKIHQSPNNLVDQKYYENVGRHIQVCYIIQHLKQKGNRMVLIEGDKKSGKTNLSNQVCWISQTRRLFKDGVYQFDMRQLRKCITIPQYIQIHHFEQKLYNILKHSEQKQQQQESSFLISFQNISKLDLNQKQNLDFFLNLNKNAVSLMFSTEQEDFLQELQKHLYIQVYVLKKKSQSNDAKIVKQHKNRNLTENSQSNQVHRKHHQKWSLLRVNINKISKDELFCIALSYLKRKQIYENINDLKEYISKNYVKSIMSLMKQIEEKQDYGIHYPKLSPTKSNQSLSQQFQKSLQLEPLRRQKSYHQDRTNNSQTINKLSKLFKKLEQELNITGKEDTRLNFYEECFEQLLSQNKTYNELSISFK